MILVGGDRMERTIADFVRACEVHLEEEQDKPLPDNSLIAVLCDAVRLSREHVAAMTNLDPTQDERTARLASDAEVRRLRAEGERMREALRPFAHLADGLDRWPDTSGCGVFPLVKMVCAARAALSPAAAPAPVEEPALYFRCDEPMDTRSEDGSMDTCGTEGPMSSLVRGIDGVAHCPVCRSRAIVVNLPSPVEEPAPRCTCQPVGPDSPTCPLHGNDPKPVTYPVPKPCPDCICGHPSDAHVNGWQCDECPCDGYTRPKKSHPSPVAPPSPVTPVVPPHNAFADVTEATRKYVEAHKGEEEPPLTTMPKSLYTCRTCGGGGAVNGQCLGCGIEEHGGVGLGSRPNKVPSPPAVEERAFLVGVIDTNTGAFLGVDTFSEPTPTLGSRRFAFTIATGCGTSYGEAKAQIMRLVEEPGWYQWVRRFMGQRHAMTALASREIVSLERERLVEEVVKAAMGQAAAAVMSSKMHECPDVYLPWMLTTTKVESAARKLAAYDAKGQG